LLLSERQLVKGRTRMEQVRLRGVIQFSFGVALVATRRLAHRFHHAI
jgi:hypothetical protein